jgi:tRNA(Ile)-lysidine synthase
MLRAVVNPQVGEALRRLGKWAAEADEVLKAEVERCWRDCRLERRPERGLLPKDRIILGIEAILPYNKMIRKAALQKAIDLVAGTEVALNANDLERAEGMLQEGRTGALLELPEGIVLAKHGGELIVSRQSGSFKQYSLRPGKNKELPEPGYRAVWKRVRPGPYESGSGLVADLALSGDARGLILRTAAGGDRFYPLGAPGEKRLFRFLADRKVSRLDKRQTWVLEQDGEIIWVIGHRISERVRVLQPDHHTWRLEFVTMDSQS